MLAHQLLVSLCSTGSVCACVQGRPDYGAYSAAQPFLNNLPMLTISLPGQERTMSLQEATHLSLHQFAALYTVSQSCHLRLCLAVSCSELAASTQVAAKQDHPVDLTIS